MKGGMLIVRLPLWVFGDLNLNPALAKAEP
jgi:hypothetical protein